MAFIRTLSSAYVSRAHKVMGKHQNPHRLLRGKLYKIYTGIILVLVLFYSLVSKIKQVT